MSKFPKDFTFLVKEIQVLTVFQHTAVTIL